MLPRMSDADTTRATVLRLIEPFNAKGVAVADDTTFMGDLEWDSLTVLDFVASVEDEFDVMITMNMQADIERVDQLVAAVDGLRA